MPGWIQNYVYEMMQNKLIRDHLSQGIEISKDVLAQDILNELNANLENNLKGPAESTNEPDDKADAT